MTRAALFALLVACVLSESLHAQRMRSGFVGHRGFSNRYFSSRSHLHSGGFGYGFFPYGEPFDYAQSDAGVENEGTAPPLVVLRPDERSSRDLERPAPKPLVIEVPSAANSRDAKALPPTIFILGDGERLETRRFLLTVGGLSFSVNRQQRVVPFDMLDIDATINANRERGIDLRIPADRNEISLSF
jgi:hypothetical protein